MTHPTLKYLTIFNDQFMNMVKDVAKTFPDDKYLKSYPTVVRGLLSVNERILHDMVHTQFIEKYRDQLLNKDESFFLSNNYVEFKDTTYTEDQRDSFITWMKNNWTSLNVDNKEVMWKYFHLLVALDTKIMEAKQQAMRS